MMNDPIALIYLLCMIGVFLFIIFGEAGRIK